VDCCIVKIWIGCDTIDGVIKMKKEFGPKMKQFAIAMWKDNMTAQQADELLKAVSY